jgi:hypothetical protein
VSRRCRSAARRARLAATLHPGTEQSRAQRVLAEASALLTRARATRHDPVQAGAPGHAGGPSVERNTEATVAIACVAGRADGGSTLADLDPLTGIFDAILSDLEASGELLPEDLIAGVDRAGAPGKAFPRH